VIFDSKGRQMATASNDVVRVFRIDTRPWVEIQQDASIADVAFSPDGKQLATAGSHISGAGGVRLFDTQTGRAQTVLMDRCCAERVRISPDGKYLAADTGVGDSRGIVIWDLKKGVKTGTLKQGRLWDDSFAFASGDVVITTNSLDPGVEFSIWKPPRFAGQVKLQRSRASSLVWIPRERY
jgi:WD40 repeat protein